MSIVLKPSEILEARVHGEAEALQKGKALPEGTVHTWGGKQYQKKGNKWVRFFTSALHKDPGAISDTGNKAKLKKQPKGQVETPLKGVKHTQQISDHATKAELSKEESDQKRMLGTMQAADDSYHADMAPEELKIVDNLVKKGHAKWTGKGDKKHAEVIEDIEQAKPSVKPLKPLKVKSEKAKSTIEWPEEVTGRKSRSGRY